MSAADFGWQTVSFTHAVASPAVISQVQTVNGMTTGSPRTYNTVDQGGIAGQCNTQTGTQWSPALYQGGQEDPAPACQVYCDDAQDDNGLPCAGFIWRQSDKSCFFQSGTLEPSQFGQAGHKCYVAQAVNRPSTFVKTRQQSASETGFQFRLEQIDETSGASAELVGWAAFASGAGSIGGLDYEAVMTAQSVTHDDFDVSFSASTFATKVPMHFASAAWRSRGSELCLVAACVFRVDCDVCGCRRCATPAPYGRGR